MKLKELTAAVGSHNDLLILRGNWHCWAGGLCPTLKQVEWMSASRLSPHQVMDLFCFKAFWNSIKSIAFRSCFSLNRCLKCMFTIGTKSCQAVRLRRALMKSTLKALRMNPLLRLQMSYHLPNKVACLSFSEEIYLHQTTDTSSFCSSSLHVTVSKPNHWNIHIEPAYLKNTEISIRQQCIACSFFQLWVQLLL